VSKKPPEATAVIVTVYGPSVPSASGFPNASAIDAVIVTVATVAKFAVEALGTAEAVI
jgi:hypothetical protein